MVNVTIDGNLIQLRTPFAYKDKCTAVPGGRWVAKNRCWEYLLTPVTAMTIMQVFGKDLPDHVRDFLEPLRDRIIQCQAIKKELIDMTVPETRVDPWHHQVVTWNMAKKILGLDEDHSIGGGFLVGLDMGCIDGEAIVTVNRKGNSFKISLKDLHFKFHGGESSWGKGGQAKKKSWDPEIVTMIRGLRSDNELGLIPVFDTMYKGKKKTLILTTHGGKSIRCTPDHEIKTATGWREARLMSIGDIILTNGRYIDKDGYVRIFGVRHDRESTSGVYEHILVMEEKLGRSLLPNEFVHHKDENKQNNDPENLELTTGSGHAITHNFKRNTGRFIPKADYIVKIEEGPVIDVYDVVCVNDHNFIANGIIVHNCGKSKIAVDLVSNYRDKIRQILVVSPNSAVEVWTGNESITGQFYRHTLDSQYSCMHVVPVTKKIPIEKKTRNAELARQVAHHQGKQFILVINYESAWREPFAGWAKEVGFDIIIADEVHRIKMPSGRASKFFARLAHHSKYRLGLTGTPLPHSPLDAFGQYRYLDPGVFGTIYGKFRAEYANMGGFEGRQVVSYKNLEQLHDKMFLIAHRVMSEDVFDLPPFIDEVRTMDLSPEERKIYDQMDKDFCVLLGEDIIHANNALVKLLRLQEITSGFLDGVQIGDSKKKLLSDVMEDFELHEPVVVFARFTNDLAMIREVAESQGRTYAELSGQHNELGKWQGSKADVLGVQIQSGKEGVDFTRARYNIYYSLGFSLGDYEQSRRRTNRPGQTREGMYIQLIANHSVDTKVMKSLQAHKEVVEDVLNQYKEAL